MLCCPQVAAQNLQHWIANPANKQFGPLDGLVPYNSYSFIQCGLAWLMPFLVCCLLPIHALFVTAKDHQRSSISRLYRIINYMSCGNLFHFLADFPIRIWVSTMKYCTHFILFHQPMGHSASTLHKRAQSLWRAWPEGSRAKALRA